MTASFAEPDAFEGRAPLRRPGIVAGIAISLVLHGLLIFGYRLAAPTAQPVDERPARTMTVWLQAPKPPEPVVAKVEPPPKPVTPRKRERDEKADTAQAAKPAPQASIASAPAPSSTPAQTQAVTLPPPSTEPDPLHPEEHPKKFDMNAALQTARKVANEKDPARAGTPVAQLDDHPLYPEQHETQLARGVASAKRGDCKNTGAGLLSPLIWLMDKKDHGCKW
jgi:outer membrane biosynthesis protein TonB